MAIPKLDLFISLFGALCLSGLGLAFPAIIQICTFWNVCDPTEKSLMLAKNMSLILFALLGLIVGTYTSLRDIIASLWTVYLGGVLPQKVDKESTETIRKKKGTRKGGEERNWRREKVWQCDTLAVHWNRRSSWAAFDIVHTKIFHIIDRCIFFLFSLSICVDRVNNKCPKRRNENRTNSVRDAFYHTIDSNVFALRWTVFIVLLLPCSRNGTVDEISFVYASDISIRSVRG